MATCVRMYARALKHFQVRTPLVHHATVGPTWSESLEESGIVDVHPSHSSKAMANMHDSCPVQSGERWFIGSRLVPQLYLVLHDVGEGFFWWSA
jgi:hypothetical protein